MEGRSFIRSAELNEQHLRRVSYKELLAESQQEERVGFVHYTPSGALPARVEKVKEPEISQEEIFRRRMEQIERETYQKVFAAAEQAGLDMGLKKREQELATLLPRVEKMIRGLEELPVQIFAAAERFLVETAIILVRNLLQHELSVQPEGVMARVKAVLAEAVNRDNLVLYVGSSEVDLIAKLPEFNRIRIEGDPKLASGSVRLESDFGGVSYDIAHQLQSVENSLRLYFQERLEDLQSEQGKAQVMTAMDEAIQKAVSAVEIMESVFTDDDVREEEADEDAELLSSLLVSEALLQEVEMETE